MAKVLVERPRGGWRIPRRVGRPCAPEDQPARESLSRGRTKWFGEHIGPLGKYVNRQVGRPWNKVFGEMRAHIKPGNTVQEHVLSHIGQFILIEVDKVAPSSAAPCGIVRPPYGRNTWPIDEGMLYVDPDDGLIKRARRRLKGPPAAKATGAQPLRRLKDDLWAFARGGVWFAFQAAPYEMAPRIAGARPQFQVGGRSFDCFNDPLLGRILASDRNGIALLERAYGPGRYAQTPRRLSRRELRLHHLKNAAP
jgi:hypothetical protein